MNAPPLPLHLRIANFLLAPFGQRYVASFLGRWGGTAERPTRRLIFMGWRLAPRSEWDGLGENVSELDRFAHRHGLR